ncbi:MAG TPA: class I SAM-dependent methyltransferase [Terriglobia bacterium]|nr:class I SAM-dependent methyltransferase [Terriglobia bacterium]
METMSDEIYRTRKQFFNDHAERWLDKCCKDTETGRCDKHENNFELLFALLPLKRGDCVLDAGCGSGVLVPFILERITDSGILYELDFAENMIVVNRSLHERYNIRFIVSDVENAPLDDASCDAVICFSCFPHFHDKGKALSAISRVLKADGVFAVAHFDSSEGLNRHHGSCQAVMHDRMPDEAGMRALFKKADFNIEVFNDEPGFYLIIAKKDSLFPARHATGSVEE